MQRSISSNAAFVFALLLGAPFAGSSRADEFVNDGKIKADFESRLGELYGAGGLPTASETLRQLRDEKTAAIALPETERQNTSPEADDPVARAQNATLVVGHLYLCGKCDKYHASLAGGVMISPDGLALTNYHVIDAREAIVFGAMTKDGLIYAIDEVLASSKRDDIALIRLRGAEAMPYVNINGSVSPGDELFVVSHPDGYFYTLTRGYLSRKYLTPKEKIPRLQITADIAKGSSGSGIFGTKGELVGIAASTNSIYYSEVNGIKENLQMVIKSGVPAESIQRLLGPKAAPPP